MLHSVEVLCFNKEYCSKSGLSLHLVNISLEVRDQSKNQ